MNLVKVFIKGQEDKKPISFLYYYPTRIKNVMLDEIFDRQTIFDFKDKTLVTLLQQVFVLDYHAQTEHTVHRDNKLR